MSKHRGGITLPSTTSTSSTTIHTPSHPFSYPCFLPHYLLLSLYQSHYTISPHLFFVAWPHATFIQLHSFPCAVIIENGPIQELLFCNKTPKRFQHHSHKYINHTAVIVLSLLKKNILFLFFLNDKCMQ